MPVERVRPGGQFRVLLAARLCVWTAAGITGIALPLALYQRTGSAALTALLAALEVTPYLLVGLLAGALADRSRTRPVAIGTCLLAAVASGSVPLAHLLAVLSVPHLFAAALAAGIAMVFFDAAMFAALPAIVSRDRLSQAFSTMTAASTVIALVGPMAGGFIAAAISPKLTLLVDAALLSAAAAVFALLREPERERSAPETSVFRAIGEALLSGLLVATVVAGYGMPDKGVEVGVAYSAITLGALAGSMLLPRLQERFTVRAITTTGLVVAAAGLMVWSQQAVYTLGIAALAVYQLGSTTVILNGVTQRARVTPDQL